jgi:hypothetical protein
VARRDKPGGSLSPLFGFRHSEFIRHSDFDLRHSLESLMGITLQAAGLLVRSNLFMTYAWYGHLHGDMRLRPWYVAAIASWSVALFEYLLQVPANRIGATELSVAQLKIMQEVITLVVFVPFSLFYLGQPVKRDFLWAGLCLLGAVYFVFRDGGR